jgi:hypothetical protein
MPVSQPSSDMRHCIAWCKKGLCLRTGTHLYDIHEPLMQRVGIARPLQRRATSGTDGVRIPVEAKFFFVFYTAFRSALGPTKLSTSKSDTFPRGKATGALRRPNISLWRRA